MIGVAIVSPFQAVRAGLRVMLSASSAGIISLEDAPAVTVHDFASLEELEHLVGEIDVLIVAQQGDSPPFLPRIRDLVLRPENEGHLALLLLTDSPAPAQGLAGLAVRAWGILGLEASAEELQAAVHALAEGLLVGAPNLLLPLLPRPMLAVQTGVSASSVGVELRPFEALTERESQVLQLLAQGLANKQIAAALSISEHTVKFHVSAVYNKLGVASRTEAVRTGVQRGLIVL